MIQMDCLSATCFVHLSKTQKVDVTGEGAAGVGQRALENLSPQRSHLLDAGTLLKGLKITKEPTEILWVWKSSLFFLSPT
jgi:hypothetical protein